MVIRKANLVRTMKGKEKGSLKGMTREKGMTQAERQEASLRMA